MSRPGARRAGNRGLGRWPGTGNGGRACACSRSPCLPCCCHALPSPIRRSRTPRTVFSCSTRARRGRRHVQARDRAQGPDHVGDGLHVQELHPRSAHRVDRQEGHGHRAEQDDARTRRTAVPRALSTMGLTVVPKGNVLRIVETRDREERDDADLQEGRPGERGSDGPLRAAADRTRRPRRCAPRSIRSARRAGNVQAAGNVLHHHRLRAARCAT